MDKPTCTIADCVKPVRARGYCPAHYARWSRTGSPLTGGEVRAVFDTPEESFAARSVRDAATGCLVWAGVHSGNGYGQIRAGGKMVSVHRYAWERANGPIPDGMLVDHTCYRRDCVEVGHLRLATDAENVRNRSGALAGSETGARGVHRHNGGYRASVGKLGVTHRSRDYSTIQEAAAEAERMRAELFGDFAGRG